MNGRARFRNRAWLAALALAAGACGREPAAQHVPPAVLMVTLDTTRVDRLGAYGAVSAATPHLDALAARAVRFERAYAVAPMTLPAHTAMFTGLLPTRTGVRWNGAQRLAPSPGGPPTLAERFRAGGYATAAFVSAAVLHRAFGLDRGFELYDDAIAGRAGAAGSPWQAERPGRETVDRALAWLAAQPAGRPVFLWVHLFEPHDPYEPPEPFATRFAADPYSGEIAAADDALGALLASPRFQPGARSIVAVLGDHGEALGEHGEATHGILLQEATLRIPWLVAAPGLAPRRVAAAVGQVDLAPTLLALAGQPPLAAAAELDGIDLGPELRAAGGARARTLYAESLYAHALYGWSPLHSTRRGDYKAISGMRTELFDTATDPGETRDLRAAQPAVAGALERALAEVRDREVATGASAAAVDAALAAQLGSLGYLSAGPAGSTTEATVDPRDRIAVHERLRAVEGQWRSGDFRGAERAVAELFAEDPRNRLLRRVVEAQLQVLVTDPTGTDATRALALTTLATLDLGERRYDEAESRARAALALEPRSARAQSILAVALDNLGRLEEAEIAYRAALALDPNLYPSEWNLALLLAAQPARRSEAALHLRRFLDRAPADDPRRAEAQAALARLSPGGAGGG